ARFGSREVLDCLFFDTLAFPPDGLSIYSSGDFVAGSFDSLSFPYSPLPTPGGSTKENRFQTFFSG
ncbi:MAG: hypothetical protein ACRDSJ_02925, partial [Rubrobacteraceae bacterium]